MPTSAVYTNVSASNPPVALVTGVIQRGDGITGDWNFDLGPGTAFSSAAMTTTVKGSPVSCVAQLQGSMDGVNWTVLATSTSTTGDTQFNNQTAQFNVLRVNISVTSGGTSPTIAVHLAAFASATAGSGTSSNPTRTTDTALGSSIAGAGSTSAAPTAGTSITTATAPNTGMYKVQFVGGFGATPEGTTLDNIGLKVNTTFKTAIPVSNTANFISQPYTNWYSLSATDQVSVYVINNASAGAIYKGYVSITQVG